MNTQDRQAARPCAAGFSEDALQFVRDGLHHTAKLIHGQRMKDAASLPEEVRHVTGQQLCFGLRDLAIERYGLMAQVVLGRFGFRATADFGLAVYALIERGELRSSPNDSIEDFASVYEFDDVFSDDSLVSNG